MCPEGEWGVFKGPAECPSMKDANNTWIEVPQLHMVCVVHALLTSLHTCKMKLVCALLHC